MRRRRGGICGTGLLTKIAVVIGLGPGLAAGSAWPAGAAAGTIARAEAAMDVESGQVAHVGQWPSPDLTARVPREATSVEGPE